VESEPKFTGLFPSNAKENAVDNLVFLFCFFFVFLSLSFSKIFALKVGRGLKSGQI